MRLSRLEQETIISFNAAEDTANIYSSDPVWARKIQKMKGSRKYSVGYEVDVPKNWIRIQRPPQLSEAEKKRRAEILRKVSNARKKPDAPRAKKAKKAK